MRLGCLGCLGALFLAVMATVVVGGGAWGVVRVLQAPHQAEVTTTAADGARAQQKIFDILRRSPRGSGSAEVTLTEPEVNGFLARHLQTGETGLRSPAVRLLGQDTVVVTGTLPLRQLTSEAPLSLLREVLPAGWLARPVWLTVHARVHVASAPRRHLRLEVERFAVGRQPLPTVLLRVLLDTPALRALHWTLPDGVHEVRIEPGRAIIRGAS